MRTSKLALFAAALALLPMTGYVAPSQKTGTEQIARHCQPLHCQNPWGA